MSTLAASRRRPPSHPRRGIAAALTVVACAATALTAAPTAHAATGFTAGDVVVYRVGDGSTALSTNGAPVFLDEYSPTGTLVQSVPLPTAASGSNKPLVASGTATSEGQLTLSADGNVLAATGYDAAIGATGLSSSKAATVLRTVALVNASDVVNSSTALNNFADQNNPRSAVTDTGANIWVGGAAGGVAYATPGATADTTLNATDKNVREVSIFDGQLYTSSDPTKAGSLTIAKVGSGEPKTATQTITNLPFSTAPAQPYGYSFLNLSSASATTPDTLYVADNMAGAILKYSLSGGTWNSEGSVAVPSVTGVTANDINGVVSLFATASNTAGTVGNLYSISDPSGAGGTLSGTANLIASAGSNDAFRGVAFAPGTVIGSGPPVAPPPTPPTITPADSSLAAAISDPTNPSLALTVADTAAGVTPDQLSVIATSSNTGVAPQSGISITGSGATRTLTLTPGSVGYSTITLTVTAPDGTHSTTSITYGVSANLGDPSDRYFAGAGDASAAIDVGGGYMVVGDDENNVLRLYNETQSGPPVKTFDFTNKLPFGTTEIDIEAAARAGNMLYWDGSMSNNSSGNLAPARSTLFAAQITGSGASTTLTYVGSYTGLQTDLVNWDVNNGHGLGANYFGLNQSVNGGVDSHEINALNLEGMEFAGSSSSTAYLAFRAPLEPTSARHLALVVPVTNIDQLVTGAATTATFGAPMQWDLGGLGVRDIKENAAGHYLVIAGTPDGSNTSFVLYSWDGNPSDQPQPTTTPLPLIPSGANQGSWETIVSVPSPLSAGSSVQLLEDNGDTAWYGDTNTAKSGLPEGLQKDLGRVFTYSPPTPGSVTLAVSADHNPAVTGQPVTFTAAVAASGGSGTPTGTVEFSLNGTDLPGCSARTLSAGSATCSVPGGFTAGSYSVVASYSGDASFAAGDNSASPLSEVVQRAATATSLTADSSPTGQPVLTANVSVSAPGSAGLATLTGTADFQSNGVDISGCSAVAVNAADTAQCSPSQPLAAGTDNMVAIYSGNSDFAGSSGSDSLSNGYDAAVLASSPSSYWSLEDNSTTVTDSTGAANGSYQAIGGGASRSIAPAVLGATPADADNQAAYFDGGYADIPNGSAALNGSAFTLELWAQDPANDCNGADYCPSLIGGGSFNSGGYYYLTSIDGTLFFFSSAGFTFSTCNLGFDTTTWHQVTVTGDGRTLNIYVDGQLCGSRASNGPLSLGSNELVIGDDTSKTFSDASVGPVDDVATYSRALSGSEIASHYAAATAAGAPGARRPHVKPAARNVFPPGAVRRHVSRRRSAATGRRDGSCRHRSARRHGTCHRGVAGR